MGRPRKYATDAERQAAFRERWGTVTFQLEKSTVETIRKIAELGDVSQSEVANQLIKFALLNRTWITSDENIMAFPFKRMNKQNPD